VRRRFGLQRPQDEQVDRALHQRHRRFAHAAPLIV
jgi:hypothetical protein